MTARRLLAAAALLFIGACVTARMGGPSQRPIGDERRPTISHDIRVALATGDVATRVTATGAWSIRDARDSILARGSAQDVWTLERRDQELRAVRDDGRTTAWSAAPLVLRPDATGDRVVWNGRRYRGILRLHAADRDTGVIVVNVLNVEAYLRGVVPLEIGGNRSNGELAAVEAQAVAARSYAYVRLAAAGGRGARHVHYDLTASTADQVYGGADAERPFSDAAVEGTAGLVLTYGGQTVDAPYSASCGGETAAADELWRAGKQSYLRPVSDRIGTSDRYYCDPAPRFAWTRTLTADELNAGLRQYLKSYATVPGSGPGAVRTVTIASRTTTGRVGLLRIETESGAYTVRGNDVRYVLRAPGGEILNSTYFSVEAATDPRGALERLVIRGNGWGHGVGLCQWGAIGRARAGQDFRSILGTYFPGTVVAAVH